MSVNDNDVDQLNDEYITRLQRIVIALIRKNNEHALGIKTAIRLIMILLKHRGDFIEPFYTSEAELNAIDEELTLDISDTIPDIDGKSCVALSLKPQTSKRQKPFDVIDIEDSLFAVDYVRSGVTN